MERLQYPQDECIDLTIPPVNIEGYKFGENLTRENFLNFVVDSFAKSRGNPSMQAYYYTWVDMHSYPQTLKVLDDFIDPSQKIKLTKQELLHFNTEYQKVLKHSKPINPKFELMNYSFIKLVMVDALKRCINSRYFINGELMDQEVLNLDRNEFLSWLATRPRDFYLETEL